jgi:hypothetical protein
MGSKEKKQKKSDKKQKNSGKKCPEVIKFEYCKVVAPIRKKYKTSESDTEDDQLPHTNKK